MQLLVQSLIRIFGIFYCIKALDSAVGAIYTYIIQQSFLSPEVAEMTAQMPSPLTMLLTTIFIYLLIAVGLFLAAPLLSRLIVPGSKDRDLKCGSLDLAIITSSAVLIAGWVFTRVIDQGYRLIRTHVENEPFQLSHAEFFYLMANIVLLLACLLMIIKMPHVLHYLKHKATSKQNQSM